MATTPKLQRLFNDEHAAVSGGPVECLGLTFENDEARRTYFLDRLREKLADPAFRAIEGFPIGSNEDILRLSDPPYYTACPNPFLSDFIAHYGTPYDEATDNYQREPFAADVSEGKNDPIYNAHSYHTKVPHKAIMRYILHYTEPGDLVFDGFSGTGMTGVAAQVCSDLNAVSSLGFVVTPDGTILDTNGMPFSRLGARHAILSDLSPAASFISYSYNLLLGSTRLEQGARRTLQSVEEQWEWLYSTLHQPKPQQVEEACSLLELEGSGVEIREARLPWGRINYMVWSDVFSCSVCMREIVFWDAAVDKNAGRVLDNFPCPHCQAQLTRRTIDRIWETQFDSSVEQVVRQAKRVPVLINYRIGNKRFEKKPDSFDLSLTHAIELQPLPHWFPTNRVAKGDKTTDPESVGITHLHHFYTKRNLAVISAFRAAGLSSWLPFSALTPRATRMHRIAASRLGGEKQGVGGATVGIINGTLYVPSISVEMNVLDQAEERVRTITRAAFTHSPSVVTTQSSSCLAWMSDSLDYIFIDPPFGGNLMYSELNFLWEAWLKIFTNNKHEAIENKTQAKGLVEYQALMTRCFQEFYRSLKPGRWMTVEFHNSRNSVWNAIQEALQRAGFVVADVRILDKQQGSFNQVTSGGAVKQDLVISAYKPRAAFSRRFEHMAGTVQGAWDFVNQHLAQLPTFIEASGKVEPIAERQNYLLYDRMIAFHIQRGATIPLNAAEFYAGLRQRLPERDGMFFLPSQVAEYDQKRLEVAEVKQLALFVSDEQSSIQWLRQELGNQPQTYQDLLPKFLRELRQARHEQLPELTVILDQNFLKDEHDRWYVPDPAQQVDRERLREKALLREFELYTIGRGKLKQFRSEAVRAGFKAAWHERDYATIVRVAQRLPEAVLQEDQQLLMYYDNASDRADAAG